MYYPNLKTSDSELRAIRELSEAAKSASVPVFELTRSRVTKALPRGSLVRRLEQLLEAYGDHRFILDLCTQEELMNDETLSLFEEEDGYRAWIEFLDDHAGLNVIPCALYDEDGSKKQFQDQVKELHKRYGQVCLRTSATEELALQLLIWATEVIPETSIIVCAVLFFIEPERYEHYQELCENFMTDVIGNRNPAQILFPGSTFPRFITDLPNCEDHAGIFVSREIQLDAWLKQKYPNKKLAASDFASVHPIRYQSSGGNWIPRIDIFTGIGFSYVRTRRDDGGYKEAAKGISAGQLDAIPACWGKNQIQLARGGIVSGGSPSYWISVRINCWISARVVNP